MSEGLQLLRRASRTCYGFGSWALVAAVSSTVLSFSYYTQVDLYRLVLLILLAISVPLVVLFGCYIAKVGADYDISSLVETGVLCIVLVLVSLILMSPTFLSGGFLVFPFFLSALGSVLHFLAIILFLALALAFPVAFITGASRMKEETGLKEFGGAMTLAVLGIIIPVLFPLAVIQFGVGLSSVAALQHE